MTVSCEYVAERLSAYMDGECTPEEAEQIRAHLSDCAECEMLLASFKETSEWVAAASEVSIPDDLHAGIMNSLKHAKAQKTGSPIHFMRRWSTVAIAASLLLCILGGGAVYLNLRQRAAEKNNLQKALPMQQGVAYDMQTQWVGGIPKLTIPENLRMQKTEEGVYTSSAKKELVWTLTVDAENRSAVLSNSITTWTGVATFDDSGILTRLEFGELIYRVKAESKGIRLILEEALV